MIIFVTTFTEEMFNLTGHKLLQSYQKYVQYNKDIKLNIYTEGFTLPSNIRDDINVYKIENSKYLQNWLYKNKDIIPQKYGGQCTKKLDYFKNRSCFFFRKVAALYETYTNNSSANTIIWLDADIIILDKINKEFIETHFTNAELYYLYGNYRRNHNISSQNCENKLGIESCFLVFNNNFNILREWFLYYETEFRNENRWDDGWILLSVIKKTKYKNIDIGGHCDNPLQKSNYKNLLVHHKGIHAQKIKSIK